VVDNKLAAPRDSNPDMLIQGYQPTILRSSLAWTGDQGISFSCNWLPVSRNTG
jgi:hypothetical protein